MSAPTYLESLRAGLHAAMRESEHVLVIGEDILDPYGGAFKATLGLSTLYPDRVIATPISEAGLVGMATGLAIRGFRPVAEIMFGDFMMLAADQLVNSAAKFPLMYRDKVQVPLVVRTPMGGGRGYGPTHSQSLEKHFLGVPGLTVVSPSIAHDPGELLRASILSATAPVLFVEYKNLYPARLLSRDDAPLLRRVIASEHGDETLIVDNFSSGEPDVGLLTYGGVSALAVSAMRSFASEEIRVRAFMPSVISSAPDDSVFEEALGGRYPLLFVEASTRGFTWSSELISTLFERGMLAGRSVRRIAAEPDVVPAAKQLEDDMLVTETKIRAAVEAAIT